MNDNYVNHIHTSTHKEPCITKGCAPTLDVPNISKPVY